MKKILFAIFASVTAVLGLLGTSLLTNNVSAVDPDKASGTAKTAQNNQSNGDYCKRAPFYGITRWCEDLPENPDFTGDKGEQEIAKYILTIVANIYGIISDIAGYVAVILVMYGGFLYITSSGDPGKSMKGQKTIVNTLIGIVIIKGSDIVIKFVKGIATSASKESSVASLATYVGGRALFWGTVIAVLMVVWGALQYSMSAGDPGKATKGKKTIISACIGIGIMLLAAVIVMLVINTLGVNSANN